MAQVFSCEFCEISKNTFSTEHFGTTTSEQGHQLLPKMKKQLKITLLDDIKTMMIHKSTYLSTKFPVKNKTDFKHKNSVVFHSKCIIKGCTNDYIGETNRRIAEKIRDHNIRDKNSLTVKICL